MKFLNIFVTIAFLTMWQATAQEMSAEWYREKAMSWAQTRREYPESAHPGPFKTRMLEVDAWAKKNDTALYYDPNKPYLLAQFVRAELEKEAAAARRQWSNPERLAEINGNRASKDPPISYEWWVPIVGGSFLVLMLIVILAPCLITAWVGWGRKPLCRSGYFISFLFSTVGFAIAGELQNSPERASAVTGAVIFFVVAMMLSFSTGRRLRSMGWKRWSTIALPVPFIPILLLFWPPQRNKIPIDSNPTE